MKQVNAGNTISNNLQKRKKVLFVEAPFFISFIYNRNVTCSNYL